MLGKGMRHEEGRLNALNRYRLQEAINDIIFENIVELARATTGAAIAGMVVNLAGLSHPGGQAGASNAAFWFFSSFALLPLIGIYTAYKVVQLRQKPSVQIMP